jgi:hypothetical protein
MFDTLVLVTVYHESRPEGDQVVTSMAVLPTRLEPCVHDCTIPLPRKVISWVKERSGSNVVVGTAFGLVLANEIDSIMTSAHGKAPLAVCREA